MKVILASQSPRRRELLGLLRIPFDVRVADIDETMDPHLPAGEEVGRVSRNKAMAIAADENEIIIAADTIVVVDGRVLGKPQSPDHARQMLKSLSGRDHQVMTGVTVLKGKHAITHTEVTHVTFRTLTDAEIDAYIATGEPMDKAGAYGIQGGAALFCEKLHGDYYNVMGLPVCRLGQLLKQIAPELMEEFS
jgi:septum formation protein